MQGEGQQSPEHETKHNRLLEIVMFVSEFIAILFFGLFVEFGDGVKPDTTLAMEEKTVATLTNHYPMYMDIHVMVFVGFGFVMTFLKNSSASSTVISKSAAPFR